MRNMYRGSEFCPTVFVDADRKVTAIVPTPGVIVQSPFGNSRSESVHVEISRKEAARLLVGMRKSPVGLKRTRC